MSTPRAPTLAATLALTTTGILWPSIAASAQQTCGIERVSVDSTGAESDASSGLTSISADGRFVAFHSSASNLVVNDTNARDDVFVRDTWLGTTERVSEDGSGGQGDGPSTYPSISADGRFVVFSSWATNLVTGDTNNTNDVFVRDRATGTTERLSVPASGLGLGSDGNNSSFVGTISPNGRYVTFLSFASNLVAADTNQTRDVFLVDRVLGTIERVSVGDQGQEGDDMSGGNGISAFVSADGRYVAFTSAATNLVAGDTNGFTDVFVRDRLLATTRRVSMGVGGAQPDDDCETTGLSTDGVVVGFTSAATNLVPLDTNANLDCFVARLATGAIERVSVAANGAQGSLASWALSMSHDGRFGAFLSTSPDLVPGDVNDRRDVFVRDVAGHTTTLMSLSDFGAQSNADCFGLSFSGDGAAVAFTTLASNLVSFDLNNVADTFTRECRWSTSFCPGTASHCPCGNGGSGRDGCANSTSRGGLLDTQGTPSVTNDSLTLVASGLPDGAPVLFIESANVLGGGAGVTFGDGLRCLGTPWKFLGVAHARAGTATFGFLGTDPLLSVAGAVPTGGDFRRYQAWYRDADTFCLSSTFNFTNGAEVLWMP